MLSRKNGSIEAAAMLCVMAAAFAWLEWLTPPQYDNHLFEAVYLECSGGEESFSAGAFCKYVAELRVNDNWRLGNLVAPLFTLMMPHWFFAILTGVCVAAIAACIVRFSGCPASRRAAAVVPVWATMLLFLPWRNSLLTCAYALNYIFSGAAAMVALSLGFAAIRRQRLLWLALPLSVVAGMSHEGIAVPAAVGVAALMLLKRDIKAQWPLYLCGCAMGLTGVLWAANSYILMRGSAEVGAPAIVENPAASVFNNILVLGALLAALVFRKRVPWRNSCFIVFGVSAVAGTALSFAVRLSARTAFWPELCAMTALGVWLIPAIVRWRRANVLCACGFFALAAYTLYVGHYCRIARDSYREALAMLSHSETGTIFYRGVCPSDIPRFTLGIPSRSAFVEPFTFRVLSERYGRPVAIVPPDVAVDASNVAAGVVCEGAGGSLFMRVPCEGWPKAENALILDGDASPCAGRRFLALRYFNPCDSAGCYVWLKDV